MATYFLDPNGEADTNAKHEWTPSTGTTAWNLMDDGVRQPALPTLGSDGMTSPAGAKVDRLDASTFTLPADEVITEIKYWLYIETNVGTGPAVRPYVSAIGAVGSLIALTGTGWQSGTFPAPFSIGTAITGALMTQARIDKLMFERDNQSNTGIQVDEEYFEITTSVVDLSTKPARPGMFDPQLRPEAWF